MNTITSVKLKCESKIPFQASLASYIGQLFSTNKIIEDNNTLTRNKDSIRNAVSKKTIFVTLESDHPIKNIRPWALQKLKSVFRKDIVGIMITREEEITYILL